MIRDTFFELFKMCHQKKNFIPLAGYFLFLFLCYIAYRTSTTMLTGILSALNPDRAEVTKYLDGFFFARIALVPTFIVLMPIVMATLGGDCIAGEIQEGSLKLYMARPRNRTQIILTKFSAIYASGFIYSLFFSITGFLIGMLLRGLSPVQVLLMPGQVFGSTLAIMTLQEAIFRYCCVTLYFSFSLMTLGTMALFFSTIFNRTSSGTLAVVTIYFVSYVAAALPFAGKIRPWLISEVMNNAFLFWMTPLPMGKLYSNLTVLAMYIAGFLLAAIVSFNYKDIR
jgi:ABC-2 type transport system permease protein